jgi:hypothetical protein
MSRYGGPDAVYIHISDLARQVTGHIKQDLINIDAKDDGGEMDPHGADRRGNPLGGLLFSNAFASNNGNNNTFQQVIEWHKFVHSFIIH